MADTHIKIYAVSPRIQYVGNGTTKTFPYQFPIFNRENINVYLGEAKQETGYTVSGAGNTDGGYVTFTVAPAEGVVVTLIRNIDIERVTDFQEGGAFRPKNINDELDRLTVFCQQNEEAINRAVKLPPTSQQESPDYLIDQIIQYRDEAVQSASSAFASSESASSSASNAEASATTASESVEECRELVDGVRSILSVAQLLEHKWFDHLVNDMAWLRADTFSWQSGQVYTTAYQHLVSDLSGATAGSEEIAGITIEYVTATDGHKIVLPSQETAVEQIYQATGVAWYYIVDTTNQRFKLPRTKYGFVGLRDSVGGYVEAGLPNLYGEIGNVQFRDRSVATQNGVFRSTQVQSSYTGGSNYASGKVSFDASRYSSVYGNSDTVQQRATQMYLYFYVGEYSRSAVEQTAGLNTELFNEKADRDAGNLSTAGKSLISGLGMPSSRYIDLTLGASGAEYIIPSNGWVFIRKVAGADYRSLEILNKTLGVTFTRYASGAEEAVSMYLPARKNDVFSVNYSATGILHMFRFYYLEGAE